MLGYEAGEEGAVDSAGYVVAGGDGEEGARVVVEADGVVETGGLRGFLAEAHHSLGRILKPPGGAELERGIVAGERSKLAGVGRFVEGEEDEGETGVVAVSVEQRTERADVLGGRGHVGALVAAKLFVDGAVVVAHGAGMKLHGEAVFYGHAGHLGEHLGLKDLLLLRNGAAGENAAVERGRGAGV